MSEPARQPDHLIPGEDPGIDSGRYQRERGLEEEIAALGDSLAYAEEQLTSLREAARAVLKHPVMNPDLEAWDRLRALAAVGDQQDNQ